MIGGMAVLLPRPTRRRWWHLRPSLSTRQLGYVVAMMQDAEAQNLHANADRCLHCKMQAVVKAHAASSVMPRKLLLDKDWLHQHVQMPGARKLARIIAKHEAEEEL